MAHSVNKAALQRVPCKLCGEEVVWVTRLSDGRRVALDPQSNYSDGTYGRVNPAKAEGRTDVVEMVPEEERWMREKLYTLHYQTCARQQMCKRLGIHGFEMCLKHLNESRNLVKQNGMTQSQREDLEPERYQVEGTFRV